MENTLMPVDKAKTQLFKNNITEAVQLASLGLQTVSVIENDVQRAELDGKIKHAKEIRKQVEALRMKETKVLDEMKKVFMAAEKSFAENLDQHIASATALVNKFIKEQIEENRRREAEIQEAAAKEASRKRSVESLAKVEMQAQAQVQALPTVTGVRKVWTYEITDYAAVPRDYLNISNALVMNAIKEGIREIPGVRIYEDFARSGR